LCDHLVLLSLDVILLIFDVPFAKSLASKLLVEEILQRVEGGISAWRYQSPLDF